MKKIIYKNSNLFRLKKFNTSNTCTATYTYPMVSTLKGAIISSIIKLDGVAKAEELFHKVKNAIIYVQFPDDYKINSHRQQMTSNSYYYEKQRRDASEYSGNVTIGSRESAIIDEIVFYIDNSIPNINLYLKNIDSIGSCESLVYLSEIIEDVNKLENVLVEYDELTDDFVYELYDWNSSIKFENVYKFNKKCEYNNKKYKRKVCNIKTMVI